MTKEVHAAHILLKAEQEAYAVKYDVTDGGKDFGEAARLVSACPSAKKDGDLGWFKRGQMVKEFEEAAFSGNPGDIIGPIKTQFGWHIIKIIENR